MRRAPWRKERSFWTVKNSGSLKTERGPTKSSVLCVWTEEWTDSLSEKYSLADSLSDRRRELETELSKTRGTRFST